MTKTNTSYREKSIEQAAIELTNKVQELIAQLEAVKVKMSEKNYRDALSKLSDFLTECNKVSDLRGPLSNWFPPRLAEANAHGIKNLGDDYWLYKANHSKRAGLLQAKGWVVSVDDMGVLAKKEDNFGTQWELTLNNHVSRCALSTLSEDGSLRCEAFVSACQVGDVVEVKMTNSVSGETEYEKTVVYEILDTALEDAYDQLVDVSVFYGAL